MLLFYIIIGVYVKLTPEPSVHSASMRQVKARIYSDPIVMYREKEAYIPSKKL